jgi:energy-coupling factor transporter ATP-binding protein EcfA2
MNISAAVGVLHERAENTELNLVVVGNAGQGKSTLVNNLLGFKEDEKGAAEVDGDELTTIKVKCHSKERDGAVVNIWDTLGLGASSDQAVLTQLSVCTQEKADLALVCVAYARGFRVDDSCLRMVSLLTECYGEDFWKHALFVMTMANCASEKQDEVEYKTLLGNCKRGLNKVLSTSLHNLGMSIADADEKASEVPFLTAGHEPGILPFEDEDWNDRLFLHCLKNIEQSRVPTLLKVRHKGRRLPPAGVGAGVGGGVGAAAGVLVGLVVAPVGIATGVCVCTALGIAGGAFYMYNK